MVDTFWDGVGRELAHELEPLFYVNQTNVLEAAVKILALEAKKAGASITPNHVVLSELHRSATLFLLSSAGTYRTSNVAVGNATKVIHQPPPFEEVDSLMQDFFLQLHHIWNVTDPLSVAGFVLWRINWVHPFKNGNGRTARAFSYLCLCLKLGFWLPGDITVIDLITDERAPYYDALKKLDNSFAAGSVDLSPMADYLGRLLEIQLADFSPAEQVAGSGAAADDASDKRDASPA
ncbi:Fic family protein [Methylobacterium platani]|uniref:Fic family protein n=1 Tax=Methylobacterium platani TaxID=427683 RepID=UPI0009E448FA|nr:Fic family protein [Methylobacterium platani]